MVRANAWSENADPEGRQATRGSAFACGKLKRGGSDLFPNAPDYTRVIKKEYYGTALSGRVGRAVFRTPKKKPQHYRIRIKKKDAPDSFVQSVLKNGSDLLSHLRSTIGVNGLNFSVRNGKRWNPATIAT